MWFTSPIESTGLIENVVAKEVIVAFILPANIDNRPVAIIGAGTLGRRIALMLANRGGIARIYDLSPEVLADAKTYVLEQLPGLVERFNTPGPAVPEVGGFKAGSIETHTDLATAVSGAWFVVEAVPEKLELKRQIHAQLDALADSDAIIGSNSSSYASAEFTAGLAHPERVLNTHFYMPPMQNALDLMSDGHTDPAIIEFLLASLPMHGLFPFVARRESTGFIFNRIWAAIKRESLRVVAEGVADPADVDGMWRTNLGTPVGPFQLMDQVGLDVVLDIETHYVSENPAIGTGPVELLQHLIDEGRLGRKTGFGFYDYRGEQPVPGPLPKLTQ